MTGFQSKRQASKEVTHPDPWRDAIDNALICTQIGTVDSFPTADQGLEALIDWHVAVALDPEVSSDAQALIDRGRAAVVEPLSDEQIKTILMEQPGLLAQEWFFAFARAVEQAHGIGSKP